MKFTLLLYLLGVMSPLLPVNWTKKPEHKMAFRSMVYLTDDDSKLAVVVTKPQGHQISIDLRNEQGERLIGKQVGRPYRTVQTRLDMEQLPTGMYRVIISDDRHTLVRKFRVSTTSVFGGRQVALER
ncbi:hypothetical protein GCM10023189_13140 [Nibrella saemangeumensis]|uniref:Por secretion system C-terminal sorting domain-containing protein n=1 Tax=Nibrella saemangeumensis TaxID=1084526 RepID=A0ABP8MJG7_9BACT